MIVGIDHVQITVLPEQVEKARAFYCGVLGLREIEKPDSLKNRGGFWLEAGGPRVDVGVEKGVDRLVTKAHVAYRVVNINHWRKNLTAAGFELFDGIPVAGYDRFEFRDPFGNRVELIEALPIGSPNQDRRTSMARPETSEYAPHYGKYVALVPENDILAAMKSELAQTLTFLSGVAESDASVCHSPYTWTIKQVVGHLNDCERIFGYRALRFARGDATPLPGFDENHYADLAESDQRPLAALAAEFEAVRNSQVGLFENLPANAWSQRGIANDNEISVRAIAYIIVGHERHHTSILRQRLAALSSGRSPAPVK
jgi:catechol 2,3-dioxygenase-like lactoylglutathione lyase family enzyme